MHQLVQPDQVLCELKCTAPKHFVEVAIHGQRTMHTVECILHGHYNEVVSICDPV